MMLVVSDTTPIISLVKIGKLDLLQKLFGRVMLPRAVYEELTINAKFEAEAVQIRACSFLLLKDIQNKESVKILRDVTGLDAGESEAIVLYDEQEADFLAIDERKGRTIASQLQIRKIGTIGILLQAYDEGLLNRDEVAGCIDRLKMLDIRISDVLYESAMEHLTKREHGGKESV